MRWAVGFLAGAALAAFWLSLGPTPRWHGLPVGVPGLYGLLLDYVPGFAGLRVASRFAMVLMLALASLAGLGVALLSAASRWGLGGGHGGVGRAHRPVLACRCREMSRWARRLARGAGVSGAGCAAVGYLRAARDTDPGTVVVELPFGEPAYELRYMYVGLSHRGRLANGYSGIFPASYRARTAALRAPWTNPDAAWQALAPA